MWFRVLFCMQLFCLLISTIALLSRPSWIMAVTGFVQLSTIANLIIEKRRFEAQRKIAREFQKLIQSISPINDNTCLYYCGDRPIGACAVNPYGPCKGCQDYSPKNNV